jgi:hypothetical protein
MPSNQARAMQCPRPRVMAPTSAGAPAYDPKMPRERLGGAWSAIQESARGSYSASGVLLDRRPRLPSLTPSGRLSKDSCEAFRGVAWTLQRRSRDY